MSPFRSQETHRIGKRDLMQCVRSHQIEAAEKEWNFLRGGLGRIGTVDGVALDVFAEVAPDRPRRRLLRVGRAHLLAPSRDRLLAFEHHYNHGPRGHVSAEVIVEGARHVNLIEALGLRAREMREAHPANLEARQFDSLYDVTGKSASDRIWFYYG